MINAAGHIRKAFKTLVATLSYGGGTVPFYENEGNAGEPYQVILTEITRADKGTKHNFGGDYTVLLEVVTESPDPSRKTADEVAGLVMQAVKPGPRGSGLTNPTNPTRLQFVNVKLQSYNTLTETVDSGLKAVRVLLRYQIRIIETS